MCCCTTEQISLSSDNPLQIGFCTFWCPAVTISLLLTVNTFHNSAISIVVCLTSLLLQVFYLCDKYLSISSTSYLHHCCYRYFIYVLQVYHLSCYSRLYSLLLLYFRVCFTGLSRMLSQSLHLSFAARHLCYLRSFMFVSQFLHRCFHQPLIYV